MGGEEGKRRPRHGTEGLAGSIVVAGMAKLDIIIGIEKIYGVVTEKRGNLCHAAVIAQERSIPYLVGTKKATEFSSKTAPS